MTYETVVIPYGKGHVNVSISRENLTGVFSPRPAAVPEDPGRLVREALRNPIGSPPLREIARGHRQAVILVSDITRPVPSRLLLPPILEELKAAGMGPSQIHIVIATGLHRGHTDAEKRALVGDDVVDRFLVEDHSLEDCVDCGATASGLPVEINRSVVEADLRICTGNIDPHYFVGYTGGAKAIMPGVSSKRSVTATHRMMLLPGAEVGRVEGNPVRAAIEEIGDKVGIDFILNVVVNEKKEIIGAVAGHHVKAHREGCKIADQVFKVPVPEACDIVIAGAGGFPKDINLYQAQKGLDNARLAVKQGGTIILVAECPEGFGDETFEAWMTGVGDPEEIIARMEREFVMGGHKALAVALTMRKAKVILVSSLDPDLVRRAHFTPASTVAEALGMALDRHGGRAKIAVMPYAGSTVPGL
ncbi:MAG TPA: nickel-dependent lactate racemase [Firmicutes bacterium]|nr:nickel-dependent lactate racemase [Bacillota bacterium]